MIAPISSSSRHTPRIISRILTEQQEGLSVDSTLELDSHADTSCAGKTCRILEYTNKTCSVRSFSNQYEELQEVPIVKAATAYDAPDGEVYILILNQALYLGDHMTHSLLCPNQARANGIIINDIPKHLAQEIDDTTHSIIFPDDHIAIKLELQRIISKLTTRMPTTEEVENCRWSTLTSDKDWDPNDPTFKEREENIDDHTNYIKPDRAIFALSSSPITQIDPYDERNLCQRIINSVNISY